MSAPVASQVEALIRPLAEELGLTIWDVEYRGSGRRGLLRVTVDRPGEEGVTVDDCHRLSREISVLLDVEDPIHHAYDLEVSSPGMHRHLRRAEHFAIAAGERVEVTLYAPIDGRKRFAGRLTTDDGERLTLDTGEGEIRFSRDQVSRAQIAPDFDALLKRLSDRKDG
jgi:ribosome maturation factor RimP